MIIVKTKNGDTFVNELRVPIVQHIKDQGIVNVISKKSGPSLTLTEVESIAYLPTTWKSPKRKGRDEEDNEDDDD